MATMQLNQMIILLTIVLGVYSMKKSSTYVQKSNVEDMQTSGTGYSYQIRSGDPFTYKSSNSDLTEGKLDGEVDGKLDDFPPIPPSLSRYYDHPLPLHMIPLTPNYLPESKDGLHDSYGKLLVPYAKGFDNFVDPASGAAANYVKSGGSNYGDAHKSAHGEKGTTGYLHRNAFAKGLKGQHATEQHKGQYDASGARTRGSHSAGNHYANQHHAAKAHRGGSYSNEKAHDKNSKTTGYHKVLNKDEFKKDHTFYDKADRVGFFNRHGDFDAQQAAKEGSFKKGGHHDSGHKEDQFGAQGSSDKGKFEAENSGYDGARGYDKFARNYQDFEDKGGKSYGSENGYSEGDKFGLL